MIIRIFYYFKYISYTCNKKIIQPPKVVIQKGMIFMNMKKIIEGIDEVIEKCETATEAYKCNNHTLENAGLSGYTRAMRNAFSGKHVDETATEAHQANTKKEPEVEHVNVDSVIDVDGEEIKL